MNKHKLTFTLALAKEKGACKKGINRFESYLKKKGIAHDDETEFNLKLLLESNDVSDCLWALRCSVQDPTEVAIYITTEAAKRAKKYSDAVADNASESDRTANYAGHAAAEAAYAAAYYSHAAADADHAAEREKQKQDLLDILED